MLSVLDWVDPQIYLEEQKMWVDIAFCLVSVEPSCMLQEMLQKAGEDEIIEIFGKARKSNLRVGW